MKEEKELTLEDLQKQLEELKTENEALKEQLEQPATEVVEEVEEELKEQPEETPEELPAVEVDDDKETALQTRLEALWQREVKAELKEAGLQAFSEFINVEVDDTEALTAKVKELQGLLNEYRIEETYQPTNHQSVDEYALARARKDPKGMLKARLG